MINKVPSKPIYSLLGKTGISPRSLSLLGLLIMVMTLGGRGRETASGSRLFGSHGKVQGSIMRPCLKTIREREGTIEIVETSMGP